MRDRAPLSSPIIGKFHGTKWGNLFRYMGGSSHRTDGARSL